MSDRLPFAFVRNAILADNGFLISHNQQSKQVVGPVVSFVGKYELYGGVVVHDPSPIQFAAIHAKPTALCALLDAGIKAGFKLPALLDPSHSNTKLNALTLCVLSKEDNALQCLERLLDFLDAQRKKGTADVPDLNFGGARERSPLSEAVYHNRPEFVKLLLKRGACPLSGRGSMPFPLVVAAVRAKSFTKPQEEPEWEIWSAMLDYVAEHKDDKVLGDRTLTELLVTDKSWNEQTQLYDPNNDEKTFYELLSHAQGNDLLEKLGKGTVVTEAVTPVQPPIEPVAPEPELPADEPPETKCDSCGRMGCDLTECKWCHGHFCRECRDPGEHGCPHA